MRRWERQTSGRARLAVLLGTLALAGCDAADRAPPAAQPAERPAANKPTRSGYLTVDGHRLYHEVHGDLASGKTPVLLLHGGMMSIDTTFRDLIPRLAATRPVIAVDQQGHGRTGDRDAPITLAGMRRDTLGALDQLGVRKAHVVGFSMGAMLGLELAVAAPDRVASLSVLSASANAGGMDPEIRRMNRDPSFKPSAEAARNMPTPADFEQMKAQYANNPSGPGTFEKVMAKMSALITSDWGWSDAQLSRISVPVLIALGDRDFVLPRHAIAMEETIPNARLAILPDTSHMTIMKQTGLILPMIESLIASTETARSDARQPEPEQRSEGRVAQ